MGRAILLQKVNLISEQEFPINEGTTKVVTVHDGELLWQRDIERPNDGAVANDGNCVINDWRFGVGEHGTFYAFDRIGNVLVREDFSANLFKAGIEADGTLAWCTCDKLVVFSLSPPKMLLKTACPPLGWGIKSVGTDGTNIEVTTTGVRYLFDQRGVLLNEWEVTKASLLHGRIYDVLRIAESRTNLCPPDRMPQEEIEFLVAALQRVSNVVDDVSGYWRAKAQRMAGELSLASGNKVNALAYFRKALAFDPKVGVVKLVRKLERELGPA